MVLLVEAEVSLEGEPEMLIAGILVPFSKMPSQCGACVLHPWNKQHKV